jgi:hypothetical protein
VYLYRLSTRLGDLNGGANPIENLAESFVREGCEVLEENSHELLLRNPLFSSKPLGRLSFLASIDYINFRICDQFVKMEITSSYRIAFIALIALALAYNVAVRVLPDHSAAAATLALSVALALLIALLSAYVSAVRARLFAKKILRQSGVR